MTQQTLMYCVGATKAGTSTLYSYLQQHPEFHMRSIKEVHFFSTLDFDDSEWRLDSLLRLKDSLADRQNVAKTRENAWKVENLQRQIDDADELISIFQQDTPDVADYLKYMFRGVEDKKVVGDITPGYGLLSEERLAYMSKICPNVRFIFLMRDPIDRLWSHVRMQACRQADKDIEFSLKARRILNRTVNKDMETHIPQRGRYSEIAGKLMRAVPADKLHIAYMEDAFSQDGLNKICDFLGLSHFAPEGAQHQHVGVELELNDKQYADAARFLAPEYEFVANTFGPLPKRWQVNMART